MFTKNNVNIIDILRCPICHNEKLRHINNNLECAKCKSLFDIYDNIPIVIDKNYSSFISENIRNNNWEDYDCALKTIRPAKYSEQKQSILEKLAPSYRVQVGPTYKDFIHEYRISGKILELGGGPSSLHIEGVVNLDINSYKDVDIIGDARNIPFKTASFDAIISNSVLEHIYETDRVIDECDRVLKKGGYIFMCVPQVCGRHHKIDYHRWTIPGLRRMFHGYDVVDKGVVLGPGMFIGHLAASLFRSLTPFKVLNKIICLLVEWLMFPFRFMDLIGKEKYEDNAHTIYVIVKKRKA